MLGPPSLADLTRCDLIKIDVEGFEVGVIDGLVGVIRRFQPAIVTEVEQIPLERCHSSVSELFGRFTELDFVGSGYREAPLGMFKLHAALQRVQAPEDLAAVNMLWVPAADAERIASTRFAGVPR